MDYSTNLPPRYKNWVSFYEVAKPYLLNGVDDLHWHVPLASTEISSEHVELQEYKYSVRFIEQQTLAELYAMRKLQTFSFDECRLLQYALQMTTRDSLSHAEPGMKDLQSKVELLYQELQKLRGE